jgi:hypothetical protein
MPMLQGTVKLPGLGVVQKKYVAAGAAAIAAFVGIGYYRKAHSAAPPVVGAQDVSAVGDTTPSGPGGANGVTNQFGDPVLPNIVNQANPGIQSNLDWITTGSSISLGGISEDVITAALANVLGGIKVTQAQADIFNQVSAIIGPPPQGLPFGPPKLTSGTVTTPPPPPGPVTHWVYVVQMHQLGQVTPARTLIQRFSDPGASPTQIEVALRKTVAANPRYKAYYGSHGGHYPAQAAINTTVVKKVA